MLAHYYHTLNIFFVSFVKLMGVLQQNTCILQSLQSGEGAYESIDHNRGEPMDVRTISYKELGMST